MIQSINTADAKNPKAAARIHAKQHIIEVFFHGL